jgi:hypothetical protein
MNPFDAFDSECRLVVVATWPVSSNQEQSTLFLQDAQSGTIPFASTFFDFFHLVTEKNSYQK